MTARKRLAVIVCVCIVLFSVTALASYITIESFPNAKIVFSGFRLSGASDGSAQGFIDIELKNLQTQDVMFCIDYDQTVIKLSDADTNMPIENDVTYIWDQSTYNDAHKYFIQNTDLFPDGCFVDGKSGFLNKGTNEMGLADADNGLLMMHFLVNNNAEGDGLTTDSKRLVSVINANSSAGVKLGTLSFQVIDPAAFSKLSEEELGNLISIVPFETIGVKISDMFDEDDMEDTGLVLSYYDEDEAGNRKRYIDKNYYAEAEWDLKVDITDVVPQVSEKTVNAYELYNAGNIGDLFDYLNANMSMVNLEYADGSKAYSFMTWDSSKAVVTDGSGSWDPKGGGTTYVIKQDYSEEFTDITVSVTVTSVELEDVYADNDNITYYNGAADFPQTLASLELPGKAHPILSPYITGVKIRDIDILWYHLKDEQNQVTDLPAGFADAAGTYTFVGVLDMANLADEYPWLTVSEISGIEVIRNVVTSESDLPAKITATAVVDDNSEKLTIRVTRLKWDESSSAWIDDATTSFDSGTQFIIRLPDGSTLDTSQNSQNGVLCAVDCTSDPYHPTVVIEVTDRSQSDYANSLANMINLGKRGGTFEIAAVEPNKNRGEFTDCTPEARRNIYTANATFDYSGEKAPMFTLAADETLPLTITLPDAEDVVCTTYNGTNGENDGTLRTFTVDSWTETTTADGVKQAVGKLASTSYTNYGYVSNDYAYTVTLLYIQSSDNADVKKITKINDFVYDPKKEGYLSNKTTTTVTTNLQQSHEFTIENIGAADLTGLYIDIDATSDTDGTEAFEVTASPLYALGKGLSTVFEITPKLGLPARPDDPYKATVTVKSNSGDLCSFTVSFTVTDKDIYTLTIKTTNDDEFGTAETDTGIYTFIEGSTVGISATAEEDCIFTGWTCVNPDNEADTTYSPVTFVDATSESTMFTMPSCNLIIKANFEETLGAKLRLSELIVKDPSGNNCGLSATDWTPATYDPKVREYNVAMESDDETAALWFIPKNFTDETSGEFGGTITVTYATDNDDNTKTTVTTTLDTDKYYKTDAINLEISPTVNNVVITLAKEDDGGTMVERTYTINIYRKKSASQLADFTYGNSPYGLIMADDTHIPPGDGTASDSANVKDDAEAEFINNGRMFKTGATYIPDGAYTDVRYGTEAWTDKNYDEDPYAVFVYAGKEFKETGYNSITNSIGTAIGADDITVTLEIRELPALIDKSNLVSDFKNPRDAETITAANTGTSASPVYSFGTIPARTRPDIYFISYEFKDYDGTNVKLTKPLIILSETGDIDVSGTVEEQDSMYVMNRFTKNLPDGANVTGYAGGGTLYKYRVCDTNKDGVVNAIDANYIRQTNRQAFYSQGGDSQ